MKVQNILIDKMIIFFNADIITLYIKELRLLGKIHAHARHFFLFKERVCYIYNHRFRYLTLYIQTTHTLHYFTGIPQNFVTIQQMMLYDNFSDADNTDDTDYLISRP